MKAILKLNFPLIILLLASCVHVDPETGKTIPQGNQKNMFADVERLAEQLKNGMTKWQVMILLGSPAEMSEESNVWVYLPERPAVLVPSHALRLEFKDGLLISHENTAIILGKTL